MQTPHRYREPHVRTHLGIAMVGRVVKAMLKHLPEDGYRSNHPWALRHQRQTARSSPLGG